MNIVLIPTCTACCSTLTVESSHQRRAATVIGEGLGAGNLLIDRRASNSGKVGIQVYS